MDEVMDMEDQAQQPQQASSSTAPSAAKRSCSSPSTSTSESHSIPAVLQPTMPVLKPNEKQAYFTRRVMDMFTQRTVGGRSIFLTGVPGAGKSAVVQYIRTLIAQYTAIDIHELLPIVATTAMAASLHDGGKTVHSYIGIRNDNQPPRNVSPSVRARLIAAQILFIDEVSMMHPTLLNTVNAICRQARNKDLPFGGLTLVLVGDLLQLPPVILDNDPIRKGSKNIDDVPTLFETEAWIEADVETIYMDKSYRQEASATSGNNNDFMAVLASTRVARPPPEHLRILASRVMPIEALKRQWEASAEGIASIGNGKQKIEPTMLFCGREAVDDQNVAFLKRITDQPLVTFASQYVHVIQGDWLAAVGLVNSHSHMDGADAIVLDEVGMDAKVRARLLSVDKRTDYGARRVVVTGRNGGAPSLRDYGEIVATAMKRDNLKTPFFLHLKIGAQVVHTVNSPGGWPVNGSKGVIVDFLSQYEYEYQWTDNAAMIAKDADALSIATNSNNDTSGLILPPDIGCSDNKCTHYKLAPNPYAVPITQRATCAYHTSLYTRWPIIRFIGGQTRIIKPALIEVASSSGYSYANGGRPSTTTTYQYGLPLRLAWADTIHASQGQTIQYGYITISNRMQYGQFYVAISRFPSLASFALNQFDTNKWASVIMAHPRVVKWYEDQLAASF